MNFGLLIGLALVVATIFSAAMVVDTDRGRAQLRRFAWFRRFELLPPAELRYRGMVMLGAGICCFAALLTLGLLGPVSRGSALVMGIATVFAITLGAALLERAANLER
jgi:voltage-gated potassium channel Kch